MTATGFNHVAIYGDDLEELVEFYNEVFGLEEVQSPNLGVPVAWLRCGDAQLHVVEREADPPRYHHFALTVDDLEGIYDLATERDLFDEALAPEDGLPIFEQPDGAVQLYIRDPAGNLVEATWPDSSTLDPEIQAEIVEVAEENPQSDAELQATLFLDG